MSITKLKWQWQSSGHHPIEANPQFGRVITGMLTRDNTLPPQPNHTQARSSGGSNRGQLDDF
jgi:hypothetical protein